MAVVAFVPRLQPSLPTRSHAPLHPRCVTKWHPRAPVAALAFDGDTLSAFTQQIKGEWTGYEGNFSPLSDLREKHRARYRTYSDNAVRRLPAFEDAGVDVACTFVKDEKVLDEVEWHREEGLDSLAQELVDVHEELQDTLASTDDPSAPQEENRCVEHLGHGVYVQHNVMSLDRDGNEKSPATILREESRSAVQHALDALQGRYAVAVTGQAGIGKTRGCMMYALQELLHRRAAVVYVGYKSRQLLLFLPREEGTYRVWSAKSVSFEKTRFQVDARVVAVIDPPEDGRYSSLGMCRGLKFVSNDADKHFRNWEKDGVLMVTSMPSTKEVVAMTKVLWNPEETPHPWQHGKLNNLEEKIREVEKRIELVGPIPRLVFASNLFEGAIAECVQGATEAAELMSDSDLYKAMRGRYTPFLAKHPASASSRLFFLSADTVRHSTWNERRRHRARLQLTPIATVMPRKRLEKSIVALRKENFEDFAFDWVCEREGRQAEIQYVAKGDHSTAYQRIASMNREELRVYRPTASNFPFIDFATSSTTWYNAKSIGKDTRTVKIDEDGARKFLEKLEKCMTDTCLSGGVINNSKLNEALLTVVTNSNAEPRPYGSSAKALKFFGKANVIHVNVY